MLAKECSPRFSQQLQIFILFILKILFILSLFSPSRRGKDVIRPTHLLLKTQSARGAMPARLNIVRCCVT